MYNKETNTFEGNLCLKAKVRRRIRSSLIYLRNNGLQKFLTIVALLILYIFFEILSSAAKNNRWNNQKAQKN